MKTFIKKIIFKIPVINSWVRKYIQERTKRKSLNGPPDLSNYDYLSAMLAEKDKKNAEGNPKLLELHKQLDKYRQEQITKWNSFVYCKGYYYQGYEKIGINGIKPTEPRMEKYDLQTYFNPDGKVLDIGANSGFICCYLSDFYKEVVGIELNPYLIKMGEATKSHLQISNVRFIEGDFVQHNFNEKFDAVFSLSNHFTIDGNLNDKFDNYIQKIFNLMKNNGILFFESHNINGDDHDLDEKFKVASKYFTLIKYKMVKAQYPADIDKMFAIFAKKETLSEPDPNLSFRLEDAKTQYSYVMA